MDKLYKIIILTSFTFGSLYLFGISLKQYNNRLIKHNQKNNLVNIDILNLSLMVITSISIIMFSCKLFIDT